MIRRILFLLTCGFGSNYTAHASQQAVDVLLLAQDVLAAQGPLMEQTDQMLLQLDRQQAALEELQQEHDQLTALEKEMQDLIVKINTRQVQELIESLRTIHEKELARRTWEKQVAMAPTAEDDNEEEQEEEDSFYTVEELEEMLDAETLLQPIEPELDVWIRQIVEEELTKLEPPTSTTRTSRKDNHSTQKQECVTHAEAAQEVQQALVRFAQDGIGLYDHASLFSSARIVHEMTSPTYIPPPISGSDLMLGDPTIRKYIPQDWEQFVLPDGWQEWSVRTLFPDTFFHSLGLPGATTAPPETILHGNTFPGSCWPMDGRKGKVTIELAYPVLVDAITIDHVSPKLLVDGPEQRNSAPRVIKVYGYSPCDDDDDCAGLSFDISEKIHLLDLEYNIQGPSVQTFYARQQHVTTTTTTAATTAHQDAGSCSAVTNTCSGSKENSDAVKAIEVQILSNWGKEEYTCMYRFRVHGEQSSS